MAEVAEFSVTTLSVQKKPRRASSNSSTFGPCVTYPECTTRSSSSSISGGGATNTLKSGISGIAAEMVASSFLLAAAGDCVAIRADDDGRSGRFAIESRRNTL